MFPTSLPTEYPTYFPSRSPQIEEEDVSVPDGSAIATFGIGVLLIVLGTAFCFLHMKNEKTEDEIKEIFKQLK
eukprot:snap_masked-scaffold_9-processed-gene-8.29-mRNA-1 protein AED:0.57 eAED:0.57 QI:0/-1/0/1/-1/1/1/0/72